MKVIVIGGGIGGASTALSLHQAGIDVRLFEAVKDPTALGVGIQVQPNAVRELTELGLGEELARVGIPLQTLSFYNRHGQLIWSEPRGKAAGYNWPQYAMHRGQLQMLLLDAVRDRIGAENVLDGHRLESFEQDDEGVTAHFETHDGRTHTERGDALIGADGLHSVVRHNFYPDEGAPRFAGQMMWRGAVSTEAFGDGLSMAMIGHPELKFVVYPMTPSGPNGRPQTNWIAELGTGIESPPREDWNRKVSKDVFFEAFQKWRFDWLDVAGLIEATEEIFELPKVDRDPLPQWSFDRGTLLGDAAHSMQPTGGQNGSQAVIDARVLARALLLEPTVEAALKRYESERLPVMNEMTMRNRRQGAEEAMLICEERAPDGFERIEDVISEDEMRNFSEGYKRAAGFDAERVNTSPSILLDVLPKKS